MARRYTFNRLVSDLARESARQERASQQAERARIRELERYQREAVRLQKQYEKEEKLRYIEARMGEVDEINTQIEERISDLSEILEYTLEIDDTISFDSLRIHDRFRPFTVPKELESPLAKPVETDYLSAVKEPGMVAKLVPGAQKRYEEAISIAKRIAKEKFESVLKNHEWEVSRREAAIQKLKDEYEKDRHAFELKVSQRNREIDEFEKAYFGGDPSAISA